MAKQVILFFHEQICYMKYKYSVIKPIEIGSLELGSWHHLDSRAYFSTFLILESWC